MTRILKTSLIALSLLILAGVGFAQDTPPAAVVEPAPAVAVPAVPPPPPAPPVATGSPEKLANIRKLIELTGGSDLGKEMMDQMLTSFKEAYPQVPEDFWAQFQADVKTGDLTEMVIPIYDKHLSEQEINDLLTFFQTPSGTKFIAVLPQISQESYDKGVNWGRDIGEKIIAKLKEKNYLQEADMDVPEEPATPPATAPENPPAPAAAPATP